MFSPVVQRVHQGACDNKDISGIRCQQLDLLNRISCHRISWRKDGRIDQHRILRFECIGIDICAVDCYSRVFTFTDVRRFDSQIRQFVDGIFKRGFVAAAIAVGQGNVLAVG